MNAIREIVNEKTANDFGPAVRLVKNANIILTEARNELPSVNNSSLEGERLIETCRVQKDIINAPWSGGIGCN